MNKWKDKLSDDILDGWPQTVIRDGWPQTSIWDGWPQGYKKRSYIIMYDLLKQDGVFPMNSEIGLRKCGKTFTLYSIHVLKVFWCPQTALWDEWPQTGHDVIEPQRDGLSDPRRFYGLGDPRRVMTSLTPKRPQTTTLTTYIRFKYFLSHGGRPLFTICVSDNKRSKFS